MSGVRRKTAANLFFASGCAGEEDRNGQTIPAKPLPAFDSLPYAREYLKAKSLQEDSLLELAARHQAHHLKMQAEESYRGRLHSALAAAGNKLRQSRKEHDITWEYALALREERDRACRELNEMKIELQNAVAVPCERAYLFLLNRFVDSTAEGILRVAWLRWMRCLNACATTSRGPPSLSGSPEVVAHALKQHSVGIPSQRKVHGARTCDCACAGGNYPDELGDLLREFMLEHSKLLGSLVAENERLRKKLADCTEDRERLVDQDRFAVSKMEYHQAQIRIESGKATAVVI